MSLHAALKKIIREIIDKNEFYTHELILEKARSTHPELIKQSANKLIDSALRRVINGIENKSPSTSNPNQMRFLDLPLSLPLTMSFRNNTGAIQKKSPLDIPLETLMSEVKGKMAKKPEDINTRRHNELEAFKERYKAFILSPSDTPNEIVRRSSSEHN